MGLTQSKPDPAPAPLDAEYAWPERPKTGPETWLTWFLLAVMTFAMRGWIFGDPVVSIDEQFYLFVGDRMLHGTLPYVDIWDRKPIGLFLIYAIAARVFAEPVIGYQLLAAISVLATARVLFGMARRFAPFPAALAGAATYPAWVLVFGGIGGQSPVFYNLPMALAAAWTLRLVRGREAGERLHGWGLQGGGIMVLVGIAMQIKYSAVFEGVFFGLTLLWLGWRRGEPPLLTGARGLGWIACALLPTGAALGAYAAMGHADAFMQANFLSVFGDDTLVFEAYMRLLSLTFGLFPFLLCVRIVWRRRRALGGEAPETLGWLLAWAAASYGGFLVYGIWYDHYVLPILLPLAVLAGIGFGAAVRQRALIGLVIGLGVLGGLGRSAVDYWDHGNGDEIERLAALVRPGLGTGCLYVNEEHSILYRLTQSCLPTRYVFPQHLAIATYRRSLGIDMVAELRRVLDSRPTVIVVCTEPDDYTLPASRGLLEARLRRDYRLVGNTTVGQHPYAVYYARGDRPRG